MPSEDAIETEHTLGRDRLSGSPWPSRDGEEDDGGILVAFAVYALINIAAGALGILIWIV